MAGAGSAAQSRPPRDAPAPCDADADADATARPRPPARCCRGPAAAAAATMLLLLLLPLGAAALLRLRAPPAQDPTDMPVPAALAAEPLAMELQRGDKPAAHVVASSSSPGGLVWDDRVAPSLVRNGVRLHGNKLVVPRDGLYFVYAAAAFQGARCPPRAAAARPLRLSVSRFSEEYPRDVPLLTAVRSVCPGGGPGGRRRRRRRGGDDGGGAGGDDDDDDGGRQLWFESLYQGAVFQLRRGDQLAATTTAERFLDLHGGGQAYFGVVGVD
ncbi:tumor necrosis factor-like [Apteryx mantelli]|uniref:Tumor necrosis factor n=1 Tax=Apteryx mantelli TaxID=2696672 RepID=A0ABM4G6Z9_9AVES